MTTEIQELEPKSKASRMPESEPLFVRVADVEQRTGIKRGTLYALLNQRAIKSVLVRREGNRFGTRLIHWGSVQAYLRGLMRAQRKEILKVR